MSNLSTSPNINIPRKSNGQPLSLLSWVLAGRPEDESPISQKIKEDDVKLEKTKEEKKVDEPKTTKEKKVDETETTETHTNENDTQFKLSPHTHIEKVILHGLPVIDSENSGYEEPENELDVINRRFDFDYMHNCVREEICNDLAKFTTHFKDNILRDINNLPDYIKVWTVAILSIKFNMVHEILFLTAFWLVAVAESKDEKKAREKIENEDSEKSEDDEKSETESVETQTEEEQEDAESDNSEEKVSYLFPFL